MKKAILVIACVLLFLFASVFVINGIVLLRGGRSICKDMTEASEYDCILILGAGLRQDGSPSDMLEDRLKTGISLYEMGVAPVILLSGDRSGEDYDEVSAMANYCLEAGVPEHALRKDPTGYSTYESMKNMEKAGTVQRVAVVTQGYHLYRALFLAEALGLEADGFSADMRSYRGQIYREGREAAARVKDFFMVLW